MADGTPIKLFIMRNHNGMTLKVMAFGGIMTEISAPDKDGKFANCVSAPPSPQPRFSTYAQTIGRVANRIAGGKFTVDGKEYQLQTNDGANTLHSGSQANFGARLWGGKLPPAKEHSTL